MIVQAENEGFASHGTNIRPGGQGCGGNNSRGGNDTTPRENTHVGMLQQTSNSRERLGNNTQESSVYWSRRHNNQCLRCGSSEHHIANCPEPDTRNGHRDVQLSQLTSGGPDSSTKSNIPRSWILLDTCSTGSIFNSVDLVTDLKKCDEGDETYLSTKNGAGYLVANSIAKGTH